MRQTEPLPAEAGPPAGLFEAVQRELKERQRAEAAVVGSDADLRALLNAPPESVFLMDLAGTIIAANETTCRRLNRDMSEVVGRNIFELLPKEVAEQRRAHVDRVLKSRCGVHFEDVREGRCLDNHIYPVLDPQGEVVRLAIFGFDITERKRTEESLRRSEERFRSLFEGHSAVKLILDPETGAILDANEAAARFYGWSVGELKEMKIQQINTLPPDAVQIEMLKARASQKTNFEFRHRLADGSIRDVEVFSNRIETGGKCWLYSIVHDITERKRLEQELARNAARLKAIVETEPECVKILSPEGVLLEMNPAGLKMLEAETLAQVRSRPLSDYVVPSHRAAFRELHQKVMQGHSATLEFEVVGLKGGRRWLATHAVPVREPGSNQTNLLGVTRDITGQKRSEAERERLEAQNRQLQKAESLGRMAGAVAHHFNNQLQAVMMNLELTVRDLVPGTECAASIAEAMGAARKAASVSSLILTYLGQAPGKLEPLDLAATCRGALSLLMAVMPPGVTVETDLPNDGPVVKADANQMQQVLTNLATNAWEATVAGRGVIRLRVCPAVPSDISAVNRFPVDWQPCAQSYACLEVADSGCGISDTDIPKICDPFYSSKFPGRGLGLPVVLGILKTHGGVLTVLSEPGRGSAFRVYLPSIAAPTKANALAVSSAPLAAGQCILVVEDEASVRKVLATVLSGLGFTVLLARDGREALDLFKQHAGRVDLVLSDLTMPGMNGLETMAALRELSPHLPVILSSGYNESHAMAMEELRADRPQAFLGKPYVVDELRDTVARVLSCSREGRPIDGSATQGL